MPSIIVGKSILGEIGFSQNVSIMGYEYFKQLEKILSVTPSTLNPIMTAMTGLEERKEAGNSYIPQIRIYDLEISAIFDPNKIYYHCMQGNDFLRPNVDFIVWKPQDNVFGITFSRDAPIISFASENGGKAIGTIIRPALMKHGQYLFSTIDKAIKRMGKGKIKVTLETSTFFDYDDGSIPSFIECLAKKHQMNFVLGVDTREYKECYHGNELGNHVVAFW